MQASSFTLLRALTRIRRFLRYVFPSLPVLSRHSLRIKSETLIPPTAVLETVHPCLLAAVYAISEQFRRYDPVLCVTQANAVFPTAALWKLSYQSILREMDTSQMHVLQAILIYIQRSIDDTTATTTDSPGDWPLLGSAVSIAKHLGLHLDCVEWPIPAWEKRLRRRIWWIVYSEAAFRGVLRGLPRLLHGDDWDVNPLGEHDFDLDNPSCPSDGIAQHSSTQPGPCPFCCLGYDFKYLASLSNIAYDVHQSLFTVAATKRLSHDLAATTEATRPLLRRLNSWKRSLPRQLSLEETPDVDSRPYFHSGSAAHLKLAALTIEVLIQRAQMRPLRGLTSLHFGDEASGSFRGAGGRYWGGDDVSDVFGGDRPDIGDFIRDFIALIKRALSYTQGLCAYDRNSFAYSCEYMPSPCYGHEIADQN